MELRLWRSRSRLRGHHGCLRSSSVQALHGLEHCGSPCGCGHEQDMMPRCRAERGLCASLPEEPLVVLHTALQPRVAASMAEVLDGGAAGAPHLPGCRTVLRSAASLATKVMMRCCCCHVLSSPCYFERQAPRRNVLTEKQSPELGRTLARAQAGRSATRARRTRPSSTPSRPRSAAWPASTWAISSSSRRARRLPRVSPPGFSSLHGTRTWAAFSFSSSRRTAALRPACEPCMARHGRPPPVRRALPPRTDARTPHVTAASLCPRQTQDMNVHYRRDRCSHRAPGSHHDPGSHRGAARRSRTGCRRSFRRCGSWPRCRPCPASAPGWKLNCTASPMRCGRGTRSPATARIGCQLLHALLTGGSRPVSTTTGIGAVS